MGKPILVSGYVVANPDTIQIISLDRILKNLPFLHRVFVVVAPWCVALWHVVVAL